MYLCSLRMFLQNGMMSTRGQQNRFRGGFFLIVCLLCYDNDVITFPEMPPPCNVRSKKNKQKKNKQLFVFLPTPGSCSCSNIHLFIWDWAPAHFEALFEHKANIASAFCHQGVAHQSASNVTEPSTKINYLAILRKQGSFSSKS